MNKLRQATGTSIFWLTWPVWRIYLQSKGPRARVLITCGSEVLLVKRWIGPNVFWMPGGGQDEGETIEQAAIREIKEELGITLKQSSLKYLFEDDFYDHGLKTHYVCFGVSLKTKPVITATSSEIGSFAWIDLKDITKTRVSKSVQRAIKNFGKVG